MPVRIEYSPPANVTAATLRPPWLHLARAAWVLLSAAAVTAFVVEAALGWGAPLPSCVLPDVPCAPWVVGRDDLALAQRLGLPDPLLRWVYALNILFPRIVLFALGVVIFLRRSDDRVALMLSLMLTLVVTEGIQHLTTMKLLVDVLFGVATAIYILLPFVFPNGRFVPRWTTWVALPLVVLAIGAQLLSVWGPAMDEQALALVQAAPYLAWLPLGGYAVLYRYTRMASATERQQIKWVMAGVLSPALLFIPSTLIALAFPPSQPSPERLAFVYLVYIPLSVLGYLFIAVGIAFAILRHRLWDIDILIRRTLIYAVLTALLAGFYFGSVIALQQLLHPLLGQESDLAIIVSTLAIAALFNPLRRRVQEAIDHRFYRRKYDAQRVLARFAATVRDEVELDRLTGELLNVVGETMQPASVGLWLKKVKRDS